MLLQPFATDNLDASATQMAFERRGKEREGDVFCFFWEIWLNELASRRNRKGGQNLSSKGRGSGENQTGRGGWTDRRTDTATDMDGSPRGGAGWVHVVLPAILAPLEGCVCARACGRAGSSSPGTGWVPEPGLQPPATGSLPSDTLESETREV